MKKRYIRINVSTGRIRSWAGSGKPNMDATHNDDILYCFWLREDYIDANDNVVERDLDLSSGLTAARLDIDTTKVDGGTDLAYQDSYNQQSDALLEDLSKGRLTFEVSFTDAAIGTELTNLEKTSVWGELSLVQNSKNITPASFQFDIHEDINDSPGTPGSPAGNYSTTAESQVLFLESDNDEDPADTTQLTQMAGIHQVKYTGTGTLNLVLVDPADFDTAEKREGWVRVMSLSSGSVVLTVDGGSNIIGAYATAASYTVNAQSLADLYCDGTNWLLLNRQV